MKKNISRLTGLALAACMTVSGISPAYAAAPEVPEGIKNVIFMIPDGTSIGALTLSRYMLPNNEKGETNLTLDAYSTALVKTRWANGPITDSAPSATAYSTGEKSLNGALGMDANKKPRATLLEAAKAAGKSTGLIATCEFMHATPAAFSSHVESRKDYANIAEQMLNQNVDVVLSAGFGKVEPAVLDIRQTALNNGYQIVETLDTMNAAQAGKIWGNFDDDDIPNDYDRAADDPSLSDMTKKALDVLSKNDNGFFLMVEGSKIDWAAHSNDPVGIVSETLAYDRAFKTALDFASGRTDTVIISVTDHSNSGISIGNADNNPGYDSAPDSILDPIRMAKITEVGAIKRIENGESINSVLTAYGINPAGYTAKESDHSTLKKVYPKVNEAISKFRSEPTEANLAAIMSDLCFIGFTTGGHTAEDVPLYIYAPNMEKRPHGLIDNTDVNKYAAQCLGFDLNKLTKELFVEVNSAALPGCDIKLEGKTLTVTNGDKVSTVDANKSAAFVNNGTFMTLPGVAVLMDGRFYVPQAFIDAVK